MFKKLIDFFLDTPAEPTPPTPTPSTSYDSESVRLMADVFKAEARFKAAEDRVNTNNAEGEADGQSR